MAIDGNLNQLFGALKQTLGMGADAEKKSDGAATGEFTDEELLGLWARIKRESLDNRWVWERQWQRALWYILNRQWIEYFANGGGWREKRMAPNVPRPVTNICKDALKAIRAIFTAISLGVNVRPNGADPKNVSAAAVADELAPFIHESHGMNKRLTEFDFWLIVTGNAFFHTFVDYDLKHGQIPIEWETCACGYEVEQYKRPNQTEPCPECGATEFTPSEKVTYQSKGRPATIALSPLEVAFPNSYARFEDVPYIVRLRWRSKWYFEQHAQLKELVPTLNFAKAPSDRSLQLFKSLATQNDLGIMPTYLSDGGFGSDEDGLVEYEVQLKPCDAYPQGLVFRVLGDEAPKILHLEESEAVPGPLPYKDAQGKPLWTWTHAGYDHVGGRILASGPIDLIIQKQDQLNQLDSMILMTMMRMAAGGWIIPKGSEIENVHKLSTFGVIVRYNPLTVQGNAKPERFEGVQINDSWFKYREMIMADAERLTGTYDIIKGAKPTGVEAFSALQLLVERSQSSFANVFMSRGEAYKDWYKFALELEREFGPDERTEAILSPARTWTFKNFKRADLNGSVSVLVEDGSNAPKTSLGTRAAIQQAQGLGMLDMADTDVQYQGLQMFGLTRMVPSLDVHIQSALQKQQAFEEWILDPEALQEALQQHTQAITQWQQKSSRQASSAMASPNAPMAPMTPPPSPLVFTPLKWQLWFNPMIHRREFDKWANGDRVKEIIAQVPAAEQLLTAHYQEMQQAEMQAMMQSQVPTQISGPGGASMAMTNSNRESTQNVEPSGSGEGAQNAGPR